jgi:hypothetical protein
MDSNLRPFARNPAAVRHRAASSEDPSGNASRSRDSGSCPPRPYRCRCAGGPAAGTRRRTRIPSPRCRFRKRRRFVPELQNRQLLLRHGRHGEPRLHCTPINDRCYSYAELAGPLRKTDRAVCSMPLTRPEQQLNRKWLMWRACGCGFIFCQIAARCERTHPGSPIGVGGWPKRAWRRPRLRLEWTGEPMIYSAVCGWEHRFGPRTRRT